MLTVPRQPQFQFALDWSADAEVSMKYAPFFFLDLYFQLFYKRAGIYVEGSQLVLESVMRSSTITNRQPSTPLRCYYELTLSQQ